MLHHLVQTVGHGFVVYSVNMAVTLSCFCAGGVQEAFVFNMKYFPRHIPHFAKLLVFGEMNVLHTKISNSNIKQAAGSIVYGTPCRHERISFAYIWMTGHTCSCFELIPLERTN